MQNEPIIGQPASPDAPVANSQSAPPPQLTGEAPRTVEATQSGRSRFGRSRSRSGSRSPSTSPNVRWLASLVGSGGHDLATGQGRLLLLVDACFAALLGFAPYIMGGRHQGRGNWSSFGLIVVAAVAWLGAADAF